jgi:CheY-like chemotaxis protein
MQNEIAGGNEGRMNADRKPRRWMLVDDTPAILEAVAVLLESFDFAEIWRFNSAAEALEVFENDPQGFELVISDLDMPEMNGFEFCQALHQIAPSQKVLLATGSSEVTEAQVIEHGFCGMLKKPFAVRALLAALETAGTFRERAEVPQQGIDTISPAWACDPLYFRMFPGGAVGSAEEARGFFVVGDHFLHRIIAQRAAQFH